MLSVIKEIGSFDERDDSRGYVWVNGGERDWIRLKHLFGVTDD